MGSKLKLHAASFKILCTYDAAEQDAIEDNH